MPFEPKCGGARTNSLTRGRVVQCRSQGNRSQGCRDSIIHINDSNLPKKQNQPSRQTFINARVYKSAKTVFVYHPSLEIEFSLKSIFFFKESHPQGALFFLKINYNYSSPLTALSSWNYYADELERLLHGLGAALAMDNILQEDNPHETSNI